MSWVSHGASEPGCDTTRTGVPDVTDVTPRLKVVGAPKKVRKPKVVCSVRGCKRPPKVEGMCKTHATEEADRLFSLAVRSVGTCQSGRSTHKGNHQCAHGFSRSYKAVRWNRRNAWCFCAGCHIYYTHKPIEFDLWMLDRLGVELYTELRTLALTHRTPDLAVILSELRA